MTPQPTICYAVKDWDTHFENSESRKVKSLTWVPVKNKHDGKGYRRVVAHPKSAQVFCAWTLIIQVASKMPARGVLRDEDGPLTTSDLSAMTGFPEHIFEEAFKVLTENKIGWLTVIESGLPRMAPETSGDAGVEQNRTEGNGTEQNGNPLNPPGGEAETGAVGPERVVKKGPLQLRAEKLMRRRPETPLTVNETRAFKKNRTAIEATTEAQWQLLEAFYAEPQHETYARKDFATLINNWNGEIDRAEHYAAAKQGGHLNRNKPGFDRNAGTYNNPNETDELKSKIRGIS